MIEKKILQKMYLEQYKTLDEIADYFNMSQFGVNYWRKKYNIRKVERWERYGLKQFTKEQKEYLYGSLLGDGRLDKTRKRYPHLAVGHSFKQKEYIKWKYEIWKQITPGNIREVRMKSESGKIYRAYQFTTAAHPDFLEFYNFFYKNNKKRITKEILNELTPFSIAVWYMDDGYYKKSRGRAYLCTYGFTYKEHLLMQNYFKKVWNLSSNIGKPKGKIHIYFNTENTIKFFEIIKDYLIPYFDYKIDPDRRLLWQKIPAKDLQYIKTNYNIKSPKLIAHKLNRSLNSIHKAAFKLGITQSRGGRKYYKYDL